MNNISKEKTMTVKEVAEILGVSAEAIKKHIRMLFPNIIKNGITTYLNEYHVTEIKKRMIPTTSVVGSKTNLEMTEKTLEVLKYWTNQANELQKENESLRKEKIENKPKIEFFDQVTSSKDAVEMKNVADILNIKGLGRNKLFEFLRKNNILNNNNQPYRQYIDCGYFRVIEQKYTNLYGEIKINLKVIVYQKGIDFILKKIKEKGV